MQIAERQAELLLSDRGPTRPPVRARVTARLPGMRVIRRPDLPRPATLIPYGTRWLIVLDASLSDREALYFQLREIKHLLDSTQHETAGHQWHRHQFAASVLMPRTWIVNDFLQGRSDPELLARRYQVPVRAMQDRLRDLGLTAPDQTTKEQP